MRVENKSLWYRVLASRYGEVGGIIAKEGQFNSVWRNNLINIKNRVGVGSGRWFDANVGREVADGTQTLFRWDPWIDRIVLKIFLVAFLILLLIRWQQWRKCIRLGGERRVKLGSGGIGC